MSKRATRAELENEVKELRRALERMERKHALVDRDRVILDNINVSYFEMNLDGDFTYFNDNLCRDFGYSREELMGMNYRVYTQPGYSEWVRSIYTEVFSTGRPHTFINDHIIRKDGSLMVAEISVDLMKGASGEAVGYRGVGRDITAQTLAMKALKENEEHYRLLAENSLDVVWTTALDGRITYVSPSITTLLGYSQHEASSMSLADLLEPDELASVQTMIAEELARTPEERSPSRMIELRLRAKDGTLRDAEVNATWLLDDKGNFIGLQGSTRDISERKRTARALQKSEERYRSILESMQEAYYEVDLRGNLTFFNSTAVKGLGYSPDEMMRMNYTAFVDEETARRMYAIFHRVFLTGEPCIGFEWVLITKAGHPMHVESAVFLRRDEKGRPSGFRGIVRDISQRKQAEEALRQSEEKYRSILETMEESYFELDLKGNYTFFNDALCRDHGYPRSALMGMNYRVYCSPETALQAYRVFNEIYRTGEPRSLYAQEIIRPDGSRRHIEMSIGPIKDAAGRVTGFRGVGRDVTERNKAQQALKESEERFRDLAMLLPESVFEIDAAGRFTFVNRIALERFGYTEEEAYQGMGILDVIVPEDHARALANARLVDLGESTGLTEYTVRRKDGTMFPALVSTTCIYRDGMIAGRRGFLIDISEKKLIEEQLMRAQKMEAIGTLAGGIAHDFNNLLMGILGNVSLLLMRMDEADPMYERLKNVEEYVQRGSDLTKQLLGFARGGKYEVRPTDLAEFTRKSSAMFGRTKKEIRIHHRARSDLWTVEVDRGQMEQVLMNLYVNAWQAMPGGGDLYISLENTELDEEKVAPHNLKTGKYVVLTITDTGLGMDEATQARIFEPFFTTKELGRGTGLGLASVYGIIRNHGGFIQVESEPGIGTSFMIYLPASERPCERETRSESEIRTGRGTVLLIDDEEMILDIGSEMLASLGYTVLTAAGGRAGLRLYERRKDEIDLVILDMVMPELGGRETFEALKRSNGSIKVVLSSGYSLDGQAQEIMQGGCKGFIQKPFNLAELSRKIREILEGQ